MWTANIPLVAAIAYFTSANIFVLYIVGQCTDIVKLVIYYGLVRKETWLNNLAEENVIEN